MSTFSTHVLDISRGFPAVGVPVLLELQNTKGAWQELAKGLTNADGRVPDLLPKGTLFKPGIYRITFETTIYFEKMNIDSFYPYVSILFERKQNDDRHHHVPLLLSPYGYSTYRGS